MSSQDASNPTPEFEIDESLALARQEIEARQFAAALGRLKALTQGPDANPHAILMLARLHGQLGLPARAQAGFERYLALESTAVHERFELGVAQLEQGQPESALQTWCQVLDQSPAYPPALYFSAVAHAQFQRPQEALQALQVLFQTTAPGNMYHERGLELAQRLGGQTAHSTSQPIEPARH